MLVRLLYASRSVKNIESSDVESILSDSRNHNPGAGVTGILCYSGNIYIQVLEGNRREVSRLYNKIVKDDRHKDVEILLFENIVERRFFNWTMGQVNLSKINPSTMLKYSEKPTMDPFSMDGRVSLALLDELIASASIVAKG
jgi:hypothetical protein